MRISFRQLLRERHPRIITEEVADHQRLLNGSGQGIPGILENQARVRGQSGAGFGGHFEDHIGGKVGMGVMLIAKPLAKSLGFFQQPTGHHVAKATTHLLPLR